MIEIFQRIGRIVARRPDKWEASETFRVVRNGISTGNPVIECYSKDEGIKVILKIEIAGGNMTIRFEEFFLEDAQTGGRPGGLDQRTMFVLAAVMAGMKLHAATHPRMSSYTVRFHTVNRDLRNMLREGGFKVTSGRRMEQPRTVFTGDTAADDAAWDDTIKGMQSWYGNASITRAEAASL